MSRKFSRLILLMGMLVMSALFVQKAHSQSGVATLTPVDCFGDCVVLQYDWFDDIENSGTCFNQTKSHTLKFDISSVDFIVDKARLRYRIDGHDGFNYDQLNIGFPTIVEQGVQDGYEYWQGFGDFIAFEQQEFSATEIYINNTDMPFGCDPLFAGQLNNQGDYNYYGLDSEFPPILELADEFNELPEFGSVPTAVTLSNTDTGPESSPLLLLVMIVSILLLPLTARVGRNRQ